MATAAAPVVLTPLEDQARTELAQYGLAMVRKLATFPNGQPSPQAEVRLFQHAWNADKVEINSMLTKVGSSVRWWSLTEDGNWGKNTAAALGICCLVPGTPAPPTKSIGIPTWYAQNQSLIDQAMTPLAAQPSRVESASKPQLTSSPVPTASDAETVIGTAKDGTTVVVQSSPATQPTKPSKAVTQSKPTSTSVQSPMVPASANTAAKESVIDVVSEMDFSSTPTTIVAAPVRSRVPWLAVGIGGAVLGGTLLYFTQKRRRR